MKNLGSHWFRTWLIAALCAATLTSTVPRRAEAQDIVEYALLLAFIALAALTAVAPSLPVDSDAWFMHLDRLENAANAASLAHDGGKRPMERASLSRAAGAASALIGMTAPCHAAICDEARSDLRKIIGVIAALKAATLIGETCGNKVIDAGEECDPSATPDGCQTRDASFCTLDCLCQLVVGD